MASVSKPLMKGPKMLPSCIAAIKVAIAAPRRLGANTSAAIVSGTTLKAAVTAPWAARKQTKVCTDGATVQAEASAA